MSCYSIQSEASLYCTSTQGFWKLLISLACTLGLRGYAIWYTILLLAHGPSKQLDLEHLATYTS